MVNPSWQSIKELVYERANGCCEYCQTCEANIGQTLHIEHINPAGGNRLDKMNRPRIVVLARRRWVQAGLHPVTKG